MAFFVVYSLSGQVACVISFSDSLISVPANMRGFLDLIPRGFYFFRALSSCASGNAFPRTPVFHACALYGL
jgi:hypothetical protein